MIDLYRNIKKRRLEIGMTQAELAEAVGYADKTMISKIERGVVDLTQSKIMAIAEALKTTTRELMGWDEEPDEVPSYYLNDEAREMAEFMFRNPQYKVLFDASRKVKPEDLETVQKIIEKFGGKDET